MTASNSSSQRRRQRGSMAAAASRATPPPALPRTGPPSTGPTGPGTRSPVPSSPDQTDIAIQVPRKPVPRLTPVKATFELDAYQLRAVKSWAGRRILSLAAVVRALLTELTRDPATGHQIAAWLPEAPAPATPAKTTIDLDPGLYGDVRAWVAHHDTTAAAALRLLLAALLTDEHLAARVHARAATN